MSAPNPTEHPFIYTPKDHPNGAARTMHGVLTLAAWAVYAYLWLPLITVLAWLAGIRTSYIELYVRNNRFDQSVFLVILVLAVVATVLLVGWAEYNRHKFSGHHRRGAATEVQDHEVAASLFAPVELSERLGRAKSVRLAMDGDARLLGIHSDVPMRAARTR